MGFGEQLMIDKMTVIYIKSLYNYHIHMDLLSCLQIKNIQRIGNGIMKFSVFMYLYGSWKLVSSNSEYCR